MGAEQFPATKWTVVLSAGKSVSHESAEALRTLCEVYWYPLYAFVRRQGYAPEDAQDLTQEFFARLLERRYVRDCRPEHGRFRSFLIASLKHFLANERDWARAQKRGRGRPAIPLDGVIQSGEYRYSLEPRDNLTPDKIFEKRWALTQLDQALSRLQREFEQAGKGEQFACLKGMLVGDDVDLRYRELANNLRMSEGALKVAIHRMRHRFGEILKEEIAHTVSDRRDVEDEIRYLAAVLTR